MNAESEMLCNLHIFLTKPFIFVVNRRLAKPVRWSSWIGMMNGAKESAFAWLEGISGGFMYFLFVSIEEVA